MVGKWVPYGCVESEVGVGVGGAGPQCGWWESASSEGSLEA